METPWIFDNFKYWEASRQLRLPNEENRRLRPKAHELLMVFLRNPMKVLKREALIEQIWPGSRTATVHDLQNVKRDLEAALDDRKLIEPISGAGYIFKSHTVIAPTADARSKSTLHVFPGAGTVSGRAYVHSWAYHGRHDSVLTLDQQVKWEPKPRHLVMLKPDVPSILTLPIKHLVLSEPKEESWWAAALPLDTNRVTGNWEPVDVRDYSRLIIQARAFEIEEGPVFVRCRLEDNSKSATSASRRQSTNWHPLVLCMKEGYASFDLRLDGFTWSQNAWTGNTADVDCSAIVQLVLGQDPEIPSSSAIIEIRDIRLIP